METIISSVLQLKNSPIKLLVDARLKEFSSVPRDFNSLFRELAFCLLTAGTSAELGLKTIDHLEGALFTGSEAEIQKKLKEIYRFHTVRAKYIYVAREKFKEVTLDSPNRREILIDKIKGLGMKEASHFLRNIGFNDYAIIDFHIIDFLVKNGVIEKPKTITKKKYIEIENVLRKIADSLNISLGELDLYLWYLETGKILK